MREKIYRFMQGRYGNDELSRFLLRVSTILIFLNIFIRNSLIHLLFWVCLYFSYFRMFSKNHHKRYYENQKFLQIKNKIYYKWEKSKELREQKKIYHIYSCPYCQQKIRIPKGKGTIIITCPKCKEEFGKRS